MLGCLIAHVLLVSAPVRGVYVPVLSDMVVYEENIRAEGPNVGFKAVADRLESIKALGVNILWLMPVTPVGKLKSAGGLGSPYAFADFNAVNPEFGTADDFRSLISKAHRLNLAVIIDWVANHSAWDNPWIKSHDDWYLHDGTGRIVWPPKTNWRDVAQLDYRNRAVWTAMTGAMQSWVDRFGIDGFRCDSAEFVPEAFWKEAIAQLRKRSPRPLVMLAEGYKPSLCVAGFDLNYGWHFGDRLVQIFSTKKASDLAASVSEEAEGMPKGTQRLRFVTNHDKYAWEGSPMEMFHSSEAIKVAFALSALDGGVPLIYSGQEVNWPERISIFNDTTIDWATGKDMRNWISQVMRIRASHPVLRRGAITDESSDDVVILKRVLDGREALILANVRSKAVSGDLQTELQGQWTDALSGQNVQQGPKYELDAFRVRILIRNRR